MPVAGQRPTDDLQASRQVFNGNCPRLVYSVALSCVVLAVADAAAVVTAAPRIIIAGAVLPVS